MPGFFFVLLLLAIAGCKTQPSLAPAIGEAYAGPGSLHLRQDIGLQSPVVATVNHGDRLEILQRRRRFVKVRAGRAEGWTDERLLLSPAEVAGLRQLSEQTKSAPSQGVATSYDTINIHTAPDRQSPSFVQVKEGEKVDVIGRRVAPRTAPLPSRPPPPAPKPRTRKQSAKENRKAKEVAPPPKPPAPKPPPDWVELSKLEAAPAPAVRSEPQPVPMDDWSLIRNAAGQSGWVLTRRLTMAIPDEVAQYAEGRRITSYFSLGETRDGKLVKPTWLWTTVEHGLQPYDFDSFRVFVWSLRHHRYETGHIERNLKGFFPVLTHPVAVPKSRNEKDVVGSAGKVPGFSVLIEKKDGLRYRRSYAFVGNMVRFSGEERLDAASAATETNQNIAGAPLEQQPQGGASFFRGIRQKIEDWRKRP